MELIEVAGLVVGKDVVSHPLLGEAHIIEHDGRPITAMSAIDWDRPTRIPTLAEPGTLPRGTGSALMNEIAIRAQRAGVETLRYAGPYPTPALFKTLLRSFRTDSDEDEFADDVIGRAMRLARDEVPIDFTPAPFERTETEHGFIDKRDGKVERAMLDDVLYDEKGTALSIAWLQPVETGWAADLGFGRDFMWARVADLDMTGVLLAGPHAIPPMTTDVLGREFPRDLRIELAESAAQFVPEPLAADTRSTLTARPIVWADLGWRAAAKTDRGFALHAAMWTVLAPRSRSQFAFTMSTALAQIVTTTIVDEVIAKRAR